MKVRQGQLNLAAALLCVAIGYSAETKPNFSGTWTLDKDKSDLGRMNGERAGRQRMGEEGGARTGGGPREPGSGGGPEGPGVGGQPRSGGGSGRPGMGLLASSITIEHEDPQLVIKRKMSFNGEERVQEMNYTTDGRENNNQGQGKAKSVCRRPGDDLGNRDQRRPNGPDPKAVYKKE